MVFAGNVCAATGSGATAAAARIDAAMIRDCAKITSLKFGRLSGDLAGILAASQRRGRALGRDDVSLKSPFRFSVLLEQDLFRKPPRTSGSCSRSCRAPPTPGWRHRGRRRSRVQRLRRLPRFLRLLRDERSTMRFWWQAAHLQPFSLMKALK